ncbi:MAG TPA: ATPase, T2SS/T4P/T4SS family [bacterium]
MPESRADATVAKVGELLVKRGVITAAQLDEALTEQQTTGKFFGTILVARGWITEEALARTLSEQLGLAYVDLASHPTEPGVLELLPETLCRQYVAIPLFSMGDSITVAMANPLDAAAIEELQKASQRHIWPVFSTPTAIRHALDQKGRPPQPGAAPKMPEWAPTREPMPVPVPQRPAPREPADPDKPEAAANLTQVIQVVNGIIGEATESGASDIHLEPSKGEFHCRVRIDGVLHDRMQLPQDYQAAVISRIKVMADMDIAEKRLPQDGRVQVTTGGKQVDLRVSTFPTVYGENVVIRILDKQQGLLNLEDLGFSKAMFSHFTTLIARPHGIILVTGPTGSGKTTTLYASLNRLNSVEKNIMTLEDPVEYELAGIRQSQVNIKAGLTFATGLRSLVRQDPDIILIGEIRDKDTADIAIHASLTGHLVFSTLHTNDAASAATRLTDMGVEPFLVSTSLTGVLAQRLVRVLCPACKKGYQPPRELLERLGVEPHERLTFYESAGCTKCRQTGYRGRIGLYELLVPNEKIRSLITQKAQAGLIREEAIRTGMVSLQQDGIQKLVQGTTSVSEVFRVTGEE